MPSAQAPRFEERPKGKGSGNRQTDGRPHRNDPDVTPWVAAEELQPTQRPQSSAPLDDVDEALMESFPCSDPPCFSHAHS